MTHPSPQDISVALDALRREADIWHGAAGTLANVTWRLSGMRITEYDFFLFREFLDTYNEVTRILEERCAGGSRRSSEIAGALWEVARIYDAEERANMHAMANLY